MTPSGILLLKYFYTISLCIKVQQAIIYLPYLLAYKTGIFPRDFGLKLGARLIGEVYRYRK